MKKRCIFKFDSSASTFDWKLKTYETKFETYKTIRRAPIDIQMLCNYLSSEWKSRHEEFKLPDEMNVLENEQNWHFELKSCPQQDNGVDCGVFVCAFALCVCLGLPISTFTQEDINMMRKHIGISILDDTFGGKRTERDMSVLPSKTKTQADHKSTQRDMRVSSSSKTKMQEDHRTGKSTQRDKGVLRSKTKTQAGYRTGKSTRRDKGVLRSKTKTQEGYRTGKSTRKRPQSRFNQRIRDLKHLGEMINKWKAVYDENKRRNPKYKVGQWHQDELAIVRAARDVQCTYKKIGELLPERTRIGVQNLSPYIFEGSQCDETDIAHLRDMVRNWKAEIDQDPTLKVKVWHRHEIAILRVALNLKLTFKRIHQYFQYRTKESVRYAIKKIKGLNPSYWSDVGDAVSDTTFDEGEYFDSTKNTTRSVDFQEQTQDTSADMFILDDSFDHDGTTPAAGNMSTSVRVKRRGSKTKRVSFYGDDDDYNDDDYDDDDDDDDADYDDATQKLIIKRLPKRRRGSETKTLKRKMEDCTTPTVLVDFLTAGRREYFDPTKKRKRTRPKFFSHGG